MISRMEITYRSKHPCDKLPKIFSTGSYTVMVDGRELTFDFEDMDAGAEIQDGYLYMYTRQKNLDEDSIGDFRIPKDGTAPVKYTIPMVDKVLRKVKKEDFTEIFYECFADQKETDFIWLEPLNISFYDFSETGGGAEIVVEGLAFSNLENEYDDSSLCE